MTFVKADSWELDPNFLLLHLGCEPINDLIILPKIHSLYSNESRLIFCIGTLDGTFYILEISKILKILFQIKTKYGGINNLTLSTEPNQQYISLSCQDDSCYIIDLLSKAFINISGPHSFITKALFYYNHNINIIFVSLDGSINFF